MHSDIQYRTPSTSSPLHTLLLSLLETRLRRFTLGTLQVIPPPSPIYLYSAHLHPPSKTSKLTWDWHNSVKMNSFTAEQ